MFGFLFKEFQVLWQDVSTEIAVVFTYAEVRDTQDAERFSKSVQEKFARGEVIYRPGLKGRPCLVRQRESLVCTQKRPTTTVGGIGGVNPTLVQNTWM